MCPIAWVVLIGSIPAVAGPIVHSAQVEISLVPPAACEVTMNLTVTGAAEIEHRLQTFAGGRVELMALHAAHQVGDVRTIGRTQSLTLRPDGRAYGFQYRAWLPPERSDYCPLWLPTIATDGRPGLVRLEADIPAGAVPGDAMPAFTWTGTHGSAALAHLPASVRIAYGPADRAKRYGLGRVMDALAIAMVVAASAVWVWRIRQ